MYRPINGKPSRSRYFETLFPEGLRPKWKKENYIHRYVVKKKINRTKEEGGTIRRKQLIPNRRWTSPARFESPFFARSTT